MDELVVKSSQKELDTQFFSLEVRHTAILFDFYHNPYENHKRTSTRYYSVENLFERFRGFLELISRFEFEFRRAKYFLNDSNFWCVQSSITHNVAVNVHVLWPVYAHTIPFRMLYP